MSRQDNVLEVWLDCDLGPQCMVGTLAHDRGQIRFHYERSWLKDARAFALVTVGNRDDHLRNHGFILGATGWRLAPAFDVNPNIDKAEHVLNIDDVDSRPSLDTVLTTAEFYGLSADRATQVIEEVVSAVDGWPEAARKAGIAGADVELTAGAFSAHSEFRGLIGK